MSKIVAELQYQWQVYNSLGMRGERAAERLLKRYGYIIVGRRVRNSFGELDVVAVDGRTVVFVEVKTRRNESENPAEAVTDEKQRRLTRAAMAFLKRNGLLGNPARFDVVTVVWPKGRRRPDLRHYINAFDAADY
ncbi:MAG: YraN family protein [Planctomycetales bacterium]|nr:YraN family protein [Planctomycetales bacterium]